jgi:MFS family permease
MKFREDELHHKDIAYENGATKNDNSFKGVLGQKGIPLLFSIYFLTFLAFSLFYAGLPIYASTMLDWTAVDLGIFLAYSSFIMILVQGPLLSFVSGKIPNIRLVAVGTVLLSVSFFLLSNPSIIILYVANTLLSLGNGLMWPSFLSLLSKTGNSTMQGAIQGYGNSMGSLASIFGLILGGIMFESINVIIFTIGACVFLVILILLLINYFQTKSTSVKIEQQIEII